MAVLTTPALQTVYGSIIDQFEFQKSGSYSTTPPIVYLTRILSRMMAAAYSPNAILRGLEISAVSGYGTGIASFTISPGFLIIDSDIVQFTTSNTVVTDTIPTTSPFIFRVGIFASYTFNASTADTVDNKVAFTTYLFDMNGNLVYPAIFGGGEKVLISSYIIDSKGSNSIKTITTSNVKTGINTTGTIKTEITIPGHGVFKVGGNNKFTDSIEATILNSVIGSHSSAFWILDIPKTTPISTSMSYWVTGIFL